MFEIGVLIRELKSNNENFLKYSISGKYMHIQN